VSESTEAVTHCKRVWEGNAVTAGGFEAERFQREHLTRSRAVLRAQATSFGRHQTYGRHARRQSLDITTQGISRSRSERNSQTSGRLQLHLGNSSHTESNGVPDLTERAAFEEAENHYPFRRWQCSDRLIHLVPLGSRFGIAIRGAGIMVRIQAEQISGTANQR
jgi:hypothetical protein